MEHQRKYNSSVPASIQILFNNEKLELMKVLCLMKAFSVQSNKQRKVGEILFYYSLVNFNLISLFDSDSNKKNLFDPSPNLYFRFQTKINKILLIMSHLKFIEIKGNISKKLDESNIKLLPTGKQFFEEHHSKYFSNLSDKYVEAYELISYSSENLKKIKEGQF